MRFVEVGLGYEFWAMLSATQAFGQFRVNSGNEWCRLWHVNPTVLPVSLWIAVFRLQASIRLPTV